MRLAKLIVVAVLAGAWTTFLRAEGFLGIGPKTRLQDLRGQFPNARFTDLRPAWLKPHQRLIDIAGPGIDGELAVKLEHEVEGTRLLAKELATRQVRGTLEYWQGFLLHDMPERIERLEASPPTDPWEVKDIRWQPVTPVSLKAASRRYGAPESDTTDEQFRRVIEWKKRGITGYANAEDQVTLLVFSFTVRDYVCAGREPVSPACADPDLPAPKAAQPARKK